MVRLIASFALLAVLGAAASARLAAPEGACDAGCDDGFVCKPDKEAGCDRATKAIDPSCWACAEEGAARPAGDGAGAAATAPADACVDGCDEGFVCKPDREAGCDRADIPTDGSCWACAAENAGRNRNNRRNRNRNRNRNDRRNRNRNNRVEAPEGACADGCDEGLACKPNKEAECDRETLANDASCWICRETSQPRERRAPPEAPADACIDGCDDGFFCKPDKEAGCSRDDVAVNSSCWTCAEQGAGRRARVEAPADACAAGCDDGFVCKPDKEAGCNRTDIATDASCWACAESSARPARVEAPANACADGCEEGDVCLVDVTCDNFAEDAACWECGPRPRRPRGRNSRNNRRNRNRNRNNRRNRTRNQDGGN